MSTASGNPLAMSVVRIAAWTACLAAIVGCGGGSSSRPPCYAPPAPPCVCSCAGAQTTAGPGVSESGRSDDVGDLLESASRKEAHEDGVGCLADLDRMAQIDPRHAHRQAMLRGECEMLVGRCQQGKQRIVAWNRDQTNASQQRAEAFAEAIASTHCRGGDASARDQLLAALQDLTQAAYVDPKPAPFCRERLATVLRTAPLVQSRGPDDTQVNSLHRTLYHAAAGCFARAGDCAGAWMVYRDNYPKEGPGWAKNDPKTNETIIKNGFDSMITRCRGQI
jgi:hypothetical protein